MYEGSIILKTFHIKKFFIERERSRTDKSKLNKRCEVMIVTDKRGKTVHASCNVKCVLSHFIRISSTHLCLIDGKQDILRKIISSFSSYDRIETWFFTVLRMRNKFCYIRKVMLWDLKGWKTKLWYLHLPHKYTCLQSIFLRKRLSA